MQNIGFYFQSAILVDIRKGGRINPVLHVKHTRPFIKQPEDIKFIHDTRLVPVEETEGDKFVIDTILAQRKGLRGYEFLRLLNEAPMHEEEWQPTLNFIDVDGTINKVFLDNNESNGMFEHLQ